MCSGVRALDYETGQLVGSTVTERTLQCLHNVDRFLGTSSVRSALEGVGTGAPVVCSLKAYLRNLRDSDELFDALRRHFGPSELPAITLIEVNRLEGDHDVELDCVAETAPQQRYELETNGTPAVAVRTGPHIYCSAVSPDATSLNYTPDDFLAEAKGVLESMSHLLGMAEATMADVFTTRVYVTNMKDRYLVNCAFSDHFAKYPLRVITEVARLPGEQRIAIECEAHLGSDREYISTSKGQKPTGPFTQGIRIGNRVYCSGVRPIDPATARLLRGSFRERAVRCMRNLEAILVAGGTSLDHSFETRVYLRNMADLPVVDEVFSEYFAERAYPVRTAVEINRLNEDYEKGWEPNHDIEIQCSAIIP